MGVLTEQTKLARELIEDFIPCRAGLDYDNLQFDLGALPHALRIGGIVTLYAREDGDDDESDIKVRVGCGAPEIRAWTEAYGEDIATDMVAYSIAHEMGRLKQLKPEDLKGGTIKLTEKMEAKADAYAIHTLKLSNEYYEELLDNVVEATMKARNETKTLWETLTGSKPLRERKALAEDYVDCWEGSETLRGSIRMWAEQMMGQCNIFCVCEIA